MLYTKVLGSYPSSEVVLQTLTNDNFLATLADAVYAAAKGLHDDSEAADSEEQTGISKYISTTTPTPALFPYA